MTKALGGASMNKIVTRKKRYESFKQRFWIKVKVGTVDECWEWQNGTVNGYGSLTRVKGERRKETIAHRICWDMYFGTPNNDLEVGHSCSNRRCVNPRHLYITTRTENMREVAQRDNGYVYPKPISIEKAEQIRREAIGLQIKYNVRGWITKLNENQLYEIYEVINGRSPEIKKLPVDEMMICGHSASYVASTGEGTNFCLMCAFLEDHNAIVKVRKALDQL